MLSCGYELKVGMAEASFRHCQLPANHPSRSGFWSNHRLLSTLVICRVPELPLNIASLLHCFSTGLLPDPTSHDARSSSLAVRFSGDSCSYRVLFIRVRDAASTAHSACVANRPASRVSDNLLDPFAPESYPPKNALTSRAHTSMSVVTTRSD